MCSLIVTNALQNPIKFKQQAEALLGGFDYKLHVHVFSMEQFYEMMKKKDSVGREILKGAVVLHGHDLFFNLVKQYDNEAGYTNTLVEHVLKVVELL